MEKISLKQKLSSGLNKFKRRRLPARKKISSRVSSQKIKKGRGGAVKNYLGLGLMGIIILTFLVFLFKDYTRLFAIRITPLPGSEFMSEPWEKHKKLNILFIYVDDSLKGYEFVDRSVILTVDITNERLGLLGVNSNFKSTYPNNKKDTLKNAFVVAESEQQDKISYLAYAIERVITFKIDRYVVVKKSGADNLIRNLPLPEQKSPYEIKDPDFPNISKDTQINETNYFNYLASEKPSEDSKMERLVSTLKLILSGVDGYPFLIRMPKFAQEFTSSVYTNLSKGELFQIFWFLRGIRSDQIITSFTSARGAENTGDIVEQWNIIPASIDKDVSIIFQNTNVKLEQAKIEVLNATDRSGLATLKGRQIENLGGRVIRIGNTSEFLNESTVYVQDPKQYPYTVREIEYAFGEEIKIINQEYPFKHVGDIVVIIGKDMN